MPGAPGAEGPPAGRDSMGTGGCMVGALLEMTFCIGDDKVRRGND